MFNLFSTKAPLIANISLIIMWILSIIGVIGWIIARNQKFSLHCNLMTYLTLISYLPILIGMIKPWFELLELGCSVLEQKQTSLPFIHGIFGGLTQSLLTYTLIRMNWKPNWPPYRPLWLMRISLLLWIMTLLGGTLVYLTLYF